MRRRRPASLRRLAAAVLAAISDGRETDRAYRSTGARWATSAISYLQNSLHRRSASLSLPAVTAITYAHLGE